MRTAFLLLIGVQSAAAAAPACGGECNDGVHVCDTTATCNLCTPKGDNKTFVCSAGCGAKCDDASDCLTPGCGDCVAGKCAPRALSKCGGPCSNGKDICDPKGECSLCSPMTDKSGTPTGSFACSAGCGKPCTSDDSCLTFLCGKCTKGVCTAQPAPPGPPAPPMPVSACGGPCNDGAHVCGNSSDCGLCVPTSNSTILKPDFKCSAGCGGKCSGDDECLLESCGNCVGGECKPHAISKCGAPCANGKADCDPTSNCNLCAPTADNKTSVCTAGCGATCASDDECNEVGCGKCDSGKCSTKGQPTPPPPPAGVCSADEYCCPDAKHCLKPTFVLCPNGTECAPNQTCCPVTKMCVVVDKPCTSPCSSTKEFCCPDAKHCLTPVAPGKAICDPSNKTACASGQVCCPVIRECVTVGDACSPP